MAGNNPGVAEYDARDAAKRGILWRDQVMCITDVTTSGGLVLTGGTTPIIAQPTLTGGGNTVVANVVRWAAGVANAVTVNTLLPGDYNEVTDKLKLRLTMFKSTAGDVGIVMTGAAGADRPGLLRSATIVKAAVTGVISDATSPSFLDLDFSGAGWKGGDAITFTLTPDAHATAVLDLSGLRLLYIGGTSFYNDTDRNA